MKEFKEGDKVVRFGHEGVVIGVDPDETVVYPVYVRFDNGECDSFTLDGKWLISDNDQSLFHIENDSEEEADVKKFNVGDTVVCNGNKGVVTLVNHDVRSYSAFVEFDNGGEDSFTLDGKSLISDDHPSLFHVDQTFFQDEPSIVDILNREGYGTLTDGDNIYVGRDGVVVATLIMRGKG